MDAGLTDKKIIESFSLDIEKVYIYSFLHVTIEAFAVFFAIGAGLLSLFKTVIDVQNGVPYHFGLLELEVLVFPFIASLIARWYTRESVTSMLIYEAINNALLRITKAYRQNNAKG